MVDESGTGVTVTTDGHTLVYTVGVLRDDVVQLVGHTTGLGNVANGTLAVELGGNNVVHHATSVTNLVGTGLDTTDGSGANDGDSLLLGGDQNFTGTLVSLARDRLEAVEAEHTRSGTPSAMIAMDLIWGQFINSMVEL